MEKKSATKQREEKQKEREREGKTAGANTTIILSDSPSPQRNGFLTEEGLLQVHRESISLALSYSLLVAIF